MSFKETVGKWFSLGMPEDFEPEADPSPFAPVAITGATIKPTEPDPEVVALRTQVAQLQAARISAEATHFADLEITAGRAFPAERETMIAVYTQAATDDSTAPVAGESRVSQLAKLYGARPSHGLSIERLNPSQVLTNLQTTPKVGEEQPLTAERRTELLKMSPLGVSLVNHTN